MLINTEYAASHLKEENQLFNNLTNSGKRYLGLMCLFKGGICIGIVPEESLVLYNITTVTIHT